jgi:hypothetical protein
MIRVSACRDEVRPAFQKALTPQKAASAASAANAPPPAKP